MVWIWGPNVNHCVSQFRNFLVNNTQWATTPTQVLTTSPYGIATLKGDCVSIMTNIGSPVSPCEPCEPLSPHLRFFWSYYTLLLASKYQYSRVYPVPCKRVTHQVSCFSNLTGTSELTSCYSVLTCEQWPVGSNGTINAQYSLGGVPLVLYPTTLLQDSGLCGNSDTTTGSATYVSSALRIHRPVISLLTVLSSLLLGFLSSFWWCSGTLMNIFLLTEVSHILNHSWKLSGVTWSRHRRCQVSWVDWYVVCNISYSLKLVDHD